jgi:TetR/AcrR family transcriptional regulator, regulator of biofilm formation and stress response
MTNGARRQERTADEDGSGTRERLIAAAAELIAEDGWGGVRMRAVAERAGVRPGLVHYHFGSMEELMREASRSVLEAAFGEPMEAMLEAGSLQEAMSGTLAWIERVDESSVPFRVLIEVTVRATYDPPTRAWTAAWLEEFRGALAVTIERARSAGELPASLDVRGTAILVAAALDGLVLHRLVDRQLDTGAAASAWAALLEAGRLDRAGLDTGEDEREEG